MARREDPIQNLETIDLVGQRTDDGGVDLVIVVSDVLTESEHHQGLLLEKLENYLRQINSPAFRADRGEPSPDRVRIIVHCARPPAPAIRQLLQNAMAWVEENNASLALRVETPR
ncbi:MAG: DUF6572 domain-containing protein [Phycisphaerales bacterium]